MPLSLRSVALVLCAAAVTTVVGETPASVAAPTTRSSADAGPAYSDDFDGTALDTSRWEAYDGPGNAGAGLRRPEQISVSGGVLTLTGTPEGTTAGMSDRTAHRYGRWETRMRVPAGGDARYHPVLLLWPTEIAWPTGGEIDYAETTATSPDVSAFLHYGAGNQQTYEMSILDLSQWHTYAVDWTPSGVTASVDGVPFFSDATASHQPPGPMHQSIQLDWLPSGSSATRATTLQVDWYRYTPV
ncbi:glycoside hydrolase family 16 protein [Marmoricola endophyticus]|uniref:glycoside hydrolase family 16 protein n=1 Tax=Marmoricola endophyticus TaxID=2040280 RepID=UPI001664918C|nr:glycoside hydrolase family 16 protein [Marmoricola endophyticus]